MKILITGSNGFVGKNLCLALKQIKNGNDKTRPDLLIDEIYEYDINTDKTLLEQYLKDCDFIFNLAGVNRPVNEKEYMEGNYVFLKNIITILEKNNNKCPIMLSSSIQATMLGRFSNSAYGKSKYAAEQLLLEYSKENDVKVFVYRFPNLFGKWCKPNYNSAISTFCYNYANDLPITVNDASVELELLYIDDLVNEMLDALQDKEHRCHYEGLESIKDDNGDYCFVPTTYKVTLGKIVEDLELIKNQPKNLLIPKLEDDSFIKKLYSTYLSYLPKEKVVIDLNTNVDERGSFTELIKTVDDGQFSVNISKPGITKGQHFHNSKWEFFIVVKGNARIEERNLLNNEKHVFEVNGNKLQAVHMLPGYTHNIINLSDTEELITLMWANEIFNKEKPDTFYEEV